MKIYEKPEIRLIALTPSDVVTVSNTLTKMTENATDMDNWYISF